MNQVVSLLIWSFLEVNFIDCSWLGRCYDFKHPDIMCDFWATSWRMSCNNIRMDMDSCDYKRCVDCINNYIKNDNSRIIGMLYQDGRVKCQINMETEESCKQRKEDERLVKLEEKLKEEKMLEDALNDEKNESSLINMIILGVLIIILILVFCCVMIDKLNSTLNNLGYNDNASLSSPRPSLHVTETYPLQTSPPAPPDLEPNLDVRFRQNLINFDQTTEELDPPPSYEEATKLINTFNNVNNKSDHNLDTNPSKS